MNGIKRLLPVLLIALTLLVTTSCHHPKHNDLIVGIWVDGYPYAAINLQGELDGFNIDIAHKLAHKLGKKIIFKDMPIELLRATLKMGQVDVIGFSFTITKHNLETMDMIDIYGKPPAEITLIFWQKVPEYIKTIIDLKKQCLLKPLAMRADAPWTEALEEHGITNIMTLEHRQDLTLPLKHNQAFAIVVGPRHALAIQKQHPEIKILKIPLDKPWGEGVGLGIKKGNHELKEKLEKAVQELKEDGTIEALKKKWFGKDAS